MPEDEYDFANLNPAKLLALDEKAQSFDYETQLRQKGHAHKSPPDIGGLFKALATEYVPTRVVHLPPKVVERASFRGWDNQFRIGDFLQGIFALWFALMLYGAIVVGFGIVIPYLTLTSFEAKMYMQSSTSCTITSTRIDTSYVGDDSTYYDPYVYFTFNTSDGKKYSAREYWTSDYRSSSDAQAYVSLYQVNHSYLCWYSPIDPTEATFFRQDIGFWDYAGLVFNGCLFLVCGVLSNVLIIYVLCNAILERRMGRI